MGKGGRGEALRRGDKGATKLANMHEFETREPGVRDHGARVAVDVRVVGRCDSSALLLRPPDAERLLEEADPEVPLHRQHPRLRERRPVGPMGPEPRLLAPLLPPALVLLHSGTEFTSSFTHIHFVAVTRNGIDTVISFAFFRAGFDFGKELAAQTSTGF